MICLLAPFLPAGPDDGSVEGWTIDTYDPARDNVTLTFPPGGGQDESTTISIPKDGPVYNAKIGVEGLPGPGATFPSNIWIDVGRDGDIEYMYWGEGYGSLGRQSAFSDNSTEFMLGFEGDDVNSSASFYIPRGAHVTKARVDVEGRPGINNGMMFVQQGSTQSRLYSQSSDSTNTPKLTVNYVGGGSTVIQPGPEGKDSRVQSGSTFPQGDSYYVLYWSSAEVRGLIEFDLSTVQSGKDIASATVELYTYCSANGQVWGVHEITGPWDEATVLWTNQPSHDPASVDTITIPSSTWTWRSWDVTSLVQKWVTLLPTNVTMDVGEDSSLDYEMHGVHNFTNRTLDFSDSLNDFLSGAPTAFTDEYGNAFVEVPVRVTSNTTGGIALRNLSVEYDWTATVHKNPHNFNLTNEVNDLKATIPPVGGKVSIPVNVHTETAGKVRLTDLNITYNGAPRLMKPIPSNLSLDEDTLAEHFVDLALYFDDDFLPSSQLEYQVVGNTKQGTVVVDRIDEHFLYVDASTDTSRNYNGNFTVQVSARDEMGFTTLSNQFTVTVDPVNDEPTRGFNRIPDIQLSEGGASVPIDLDAGDYFEDVDGDRLIYWTVIDPLNSYAGENISIVIDNDTSEMVVYGNGDFSGADIPVRVHCDDGVGYDPNVYWEIGVTVVNVNDDPPFWDPIAPVHIEEDGKLEDAFSVERYVHDIDNPVETLRFTVSGNTNSSKVSVKIDDGNYVDIRATGANWTGESTITLRATDDGENYGEVEFRVIVDPVNDLPMTTLISPRRGSMVSSDLVLLEWEGVDAETPADELTYNIYMGEATADTLVARDVTGDSYEVRVEDGQTYHWSVAGSDGTAYGPKARERVFTVDLNSGPRVTLITPRDGAIVTVESVTLTWNLKERPSGMGGPVSYDVYFGTDPGNLTVAQRDVSGDEWSADGLEDGKEYHWRVIPEDNLGRGVCLSGVWSFVVDMGFGGYGVSLSLSAPTLEVRSDNSGTLTATIENTGSADDVYSIEATIPDVPGARITFSEDDPAAMSIAVGASSDVTMTIRLPLSTASGSYRLVVTSTSLRGEIDTSAEATVVVGGSGDGGQDGSDGDGGTGTDTSDNEGVLGEDTDLFVILLIVVVALLVVVVAMLGILYRKKSERLKELEGRRRLEPAAMVDAELAFSPEGAAGAGLEGTGAVPQDRQLATGAAAAGAAGAAATPEPLALPRVATGGEEAPGTGSDGDITDFGVGAAEPPSLDAEPHSTTTAPGTVDAQVTPEVSPPTTAGAGAQAPKPRPRPRPKAKPPDGKPRPPAGDKPAQDKPAQDKVEGKAEGRDEGKEAGKKGGGKGGKETDVGTLPGTLPGQ